MSDTERDYDDEAAQLAAKRAMAQNPAERFAHDANRIFVDGEKRFGDFEGAVGAINKAGLTDNAAIEQILECDDPARVIHELRQDPDALKAIAAAPPVRRAAMLSALERNEPMPTFNSTPAWRQSKDPLTNPNASAKEFSAAWDRKYLGKDR